MTRTEALAAKARAEAEEVKAKHFDGPEETREHHMGCGYGSSTPCPGEPDWSFARADVPALVAALEEAQGHLRSLLPMVDPRYYDSGATMLAEAQRCNSEYNGREGGA